MGRVSAWPSAGFGTSASRSTNVSCSGHGGTGLPERVQNRYIRIQVSGIGDQKQKCVRYPVSDARCLIPDYFSLASIASTVATAAPGRREQLRLMPVTRAGPVRFSYFTLISS